MCPAPTPLEYLEYDEEVEELQDADEDDLFGSGSEREDDIVAVTGAAGPSSVGLQRHNPARPLASSARGLIPAREASSATYKGKEKARPADPGDRLDELRFMRTPQSGRRADSRGVDSLKAIAMIIVRQNAPRIWDIGDLEYRVVADFVNELPMEQLAEIEANSPHIRKDTDWLWEYFLLTDQPLFYSQCREKQGQARTSGWRRMYKKALEEAEKRKTNAAERMQQRYKELEEQKQARKTVFVDKLTVPTKGKAARGRHGGMTIVRAGQQRPMPSSSAGPAHGKGIFGKARAEAQRAQVAKTHASGKFDPRVANRLAQPVRPALSSPKTFENPWAARSAPVKTVQGPRIPASKGIRAAGRRPTAESPVPSPLPGARPLVADRTALPEKMLSSAATASTPPGERYRHENGKLARIARPQVENFIPPSAPTASLNLGVKRPVSPATQSPLRSRSAPSRPLTPAEEAARLNSVLFVKKRPRPSRPG